VRWHEHLSDRSSAIQRLFGHKLWIDDSSHLTIGTLRVRLQRIKRKHGLALAVVDYLQLMTGEGQNRTQEIGSISRGLKAISKEFNIPLIAVSQLNRGVEARTDKRPLLSDLRESGEIEQDADQIVMLYRDEYYDEHSYARGYAEAIVRKHRDGPTGTAWLKFEPNFARFRVFTGLPPQAPQASNRAPRGDGFVARSDDFKKNAAGDRS
jgi:replicative DNA helicase